MLMLPHARPLLRCSSTPYGTKFPMEGRIIHISLGMVKAQRSRKKKKSDYVKSNGRSLCFLKKESIN